MGSCKIALFLAFASIAIATVNCATCYVCSTVVGDEACSKPQDPGTSRTFNCSDISEDTACAQISFVRGGTPGVARGCILDGATCDDVKKQLDPLNIELKGCKVCNDDLCNGE